MKPFFSSHIKVFCTREVTILFEFSMEVVVWRIFTMRKEGKEAKSPEVVFLNLEELLGKDLTRRFRNGSDGA